MEVRVRRFEERDAEAVSGLIVRTMRVSNTADYPVAWMEALAERQRPEDVLRRASVSHFYVAEAGGRIVGCGAVAPDGEDGSVLSSVFVLPECQRRGVGRRILAALEGDPYSLRARRITLRASLTGMPFYRRLGYAFRDGADRPDGELLYAMEKRREACGD